MFRPWEKRGIPVVVDSDRAEDEGECAGPTRKKICHLHTEAKEIVINVQGLIALPLPV